MNEKNYYSILGVDRNASDNDIKKAYRKRALESHPDINADKNAEETFKKISEAYAVLNNKEKRMRYDLTGNTDSSPTAHPNYAYSGMPGGAFCRGRGMGMGRRCGMGGFQRRFHPSNQGAHLENKKFIFNLPLSLDEAIKGIEKDVYLNWGIFVGQYKAIIPSGTKDGDLIEIAINKTTKSNNNCFLRVSITE